MYAVLQKSATGVIYLSAFLFSVNAVLPLFILTVLGWLLTKLKVWNDDFLKTANTLSFNIFIPAMLFYNISTSDFGNVFDSKLLAFCIISVLLICVLGLIAVSFITKDRARRGVVVQALFRGNFALLGVPLCEALVGAQGAEIASVFLAFMVPTFNILATVVLSFYSNNPIESPVKIIKNIFRNPLIVSCLLGLFFSLAKIPLPEVILKPISSLKAVATPFSLLVLGGDFKFRSFVNNLGYVLTTGLTRLVLLPALAVFVAALLGFRGIHIALIIVTFATPVAVSSTAMTYKMNGDYDLACELVVFTTIASTVTVTLFAFVTKLLNLI